MILLLDTTTNPTTIGLWDGKKLKTKSIESNPENNRKLVSIIKKFLQPGTPHRLNLWDEIKAIGVINGPGTFTGVRTGVTIANTISYALKIPLYSMDTLTAQVPLLTNPSNLSQPTTPINNVVSLVSASNSEVYFARFEKGKMIGKIELINVEDNLKNRLKNGDYIACDIKCEHAQNIQYPISSISSKRRIECLLQMIINKKLRPTKQVLPLYIKKPNITISKKNK